MSRGASVARQVRMPPRPVCLSCVSFDIEAVVDGESADVELFACFECRDVFYFMADARPRLRRLGVCELYER